MKKQSNITELAQEIREDLEEFRDNYGFLTELDPLFRAIDERKPLSVIFEIVDRLKND